MSNLRDIKQRIYSVKKTKKITLAMKMVAAAKFKRAQKKLNHAKVYGQELQFVLDDLASRLEPSDLSDLLTPNSSSKKAVIIVAGDRGLCGGFNTNIIKKAARFLSTQPKDSIDLYLIGNKACQYFKKYEYTIKKTYPYFLDGLTESKASKLIDPLVQLYQNNEYGEVCLFYNEFISVAANNQKKTPLLPIQLNNWSPKNRLEASDFFYEPSKPEVLNSFLTKYLTYTIFQALLESQTSEEGSRMAAMDNASENASEVIYDLTLLFNRTRQAAITTEISEIVAGATSLT